MSWLTSVWKDKECFRGSRKGLLTPLFALVFLRLLLSLFAMSAKDCSRHNLDIHTVIQRKMMLWNATGCNEEKQSEYWCEKGCAKRATYYYIVIISLLFQLFLLLFALFQNWKQQFGWVFVNCKKRPIDASPSTTAGISWQLQASTIKVSYPSAGPAEIHRLAGCMKAILHAWLPKLSTVWAIAASLSCHTWSARPRSTRTWKKNEDNEDNEYNDYIPLEFPNQIP
jgi:hypothetical protein